MRRLGPAACIGFVVAAMTPAPTRAALDIVVSVSPTKGYVGQPVEVLVRTFVPVSEDVVDLPRPSVTYPFASGLWNVLYPIDYEFDVIARSPTGEEQNVNLARDGSDASLWRGSFTPTSAGLWSIVMRNFPTLAPIQFEVGAETTTSGSWLVAIAALVAGLAAGVVLARVTKRSSVT